MVGFTTLYETGSQTNMNKIVRTEDNDQLLGELGSLITLVDPHRLHKQAASNAMSRSMLAEHRPDRDHFLMHVIAMGDYDAYGYNRNADAFTKQANEQYHHTFVDDGHFFREHRNTDPSLKIGDVRASIHNPEMNRVELAVWGHKKKASDVYDRIRSSENVSVSMSCMVDYDVDSITGKRCKSAAEYEPHMRTQPGQYIPAFRKYAFVYNPHPRFFDISYVSRPADRIAHYLDFYLNDEDGDMRKAASAGGVIPGARLAEAEGILVPARLVEGTAALRPYTRTLLEKFAAHERDYQHALQGQGELVLVDFVKNAAEYTFAPNTELDGTTIRALRDLQPATLFGELAKRATVLPFYSFLSYATGESVEALQKDAKAHAAHSMLPRVFRDMMGDCCVLDDGMFEPHEHGFMSALDPANDDVVQELMNQATEDLTVAPQSCGQRTISIRIELGARRPSEVRAEGKEQSEEAKPDEEKPTKSEKKAEHAGRSAKELAHLYGIYKLAAAAAIAQHSNYALDNQMFMRLIAQNQI